jgi:hypothetical protein
MWSAPPEPGLIAGFFGAKSRPEQRLTAAREEFERAELEYERAEVARQERIREQTSRYEADLLAYQNDIARHNSCIAQISAGIPGSRECSVLLGTSTGRHAVARGCSARGLRWPTRREESRLSYAPAAVG